MKICSISFSRFSQAYSPLVQPPGFKARSPDCQSRVLTSTHSWGLLLTLDMKSFELICWYFWLFSNQVQLVTKAGECRKLTKKPVGGDNNIGSIVTNPSVMIYWWNKSHLDHSFGLIGAAWMSLSRCVVRI